MTMTSQNTASLAARETDEHKYARHTRNATCFIAVTIALEILVGLVFGIVLAVALHHASLSGGVPTVSPTCASVGGLDYTC